MGIHDELLAAETEGTYLEIDWNSRRITIPDEMPCLGVYNDKDSNRVWFKCPVAYGDYRVADYGLYVNFVNTGASGQQYDGDIYDIDDAQVDGDEMTFSWLVGRRAYLEEGETSFVVCCKIVDDDNNIVRELNTTLTSLPILEGLEPDPPTEQDFPDYLRSVQAEMQTLENLMGHLTVRSGIAFAQCFTSATEQTKELSIDGITELYDGLALCVYFYQGNNVPAYLNINSLGNVSISANPMDETATSVFWTGETAILFTYTMYCWVPVSYNYCGYVRCEQEAYIDSKLLEINNTVIYDGTRITVLFIYGNTAENPTLRFINMVKEFEIIGNTDWDAGEYVDFVFDGEKWIVR